MKKLVIGFVLLLVGFLGFSDDNPMKDFETSVITDIPADAKIAAKFLGKPVTSSFCVKINDSAYTYLDKYRFCLFGSVEVKDAVFSR
jgi:hypothetical protein